MIIHNVPLISIDLRYDLFRVFGSFGVYELYMIINEHKYLVLKIK